MCYVNVLRSKKSQKLPRDALLVIKEESDWIPKGIRVARAEGAVHLTISALKPPKYLCFTVFSALSHVFEKPGKTGRDYQRL
jgi:hypothetical protein